MTNRDRHSLHLTYLDERTILRDPCYMRSGAFGCITSTHSICWGAALIISLFAQSASADRIDDELLAQMPKLIKACQEKGYSRVGVLTFIYQHGDRPSQFRGAAINSNMPQRVENALVLMLKSQAPELVVMQQASATVGKLMPRASYRTAADRQRLLELPLTPAWGKAERVNADAFIIGKVRSSPDLRKVIVSVGTFDRHSMHDILEFEVRTDRYILADIGQGFSLFRTRIRGVTDDAVFNCIAKDMEQTPKSEELSNVPIGSKPPINDSKLALVDPKLRVNDAKSPPNGAKLTEGFPVKLTVYYDNLPQPMTLDHLSVGSNNFALPEPKEGHSLTFGVTNITSNPVGIVLLVNGKSTLYEQEGEAKDLNKWVLQPGVEYRVKGYHQKGNEKYFEITTLSEKDSEERYGDLGGQQFAGLIHLYVFTTVIGDLEETPKFVRSIGRLPRPEREAARHESIADLKQAIARKSDLFPPGTRPLAGWGKEMVETLAEAQLGTTALTDTLIVRYWKARP